MTQPTLFTLFNKDRASEPISETQDSQAQDSSQSDLEALKSHARQILVSLALTR